ncbi:MAG TPA: dihydroneopterin aldolase [Burkholderiaceae bacterium]|jgi:dihydroneopterin aldolase|nr:dihydroneopterin aldolase [Burkholderiaceae bacterium]
MDKIFVSGLRVEAMIGIYPDERVSTRPVQIDLEIGVPGERVFRSGDVADTVDYAVVAERIRAELARTRFGLLEQMSEAIAGILLDEFKAPWVRVTIVKLGVLGEGIKVGVSIERRAPKQHDARLMPRRNGVPVGPDYRILMSGHLEGADAAAQHAGPTPGRTPS